MFIQEIRFMWYRYLVEKLQERHIIQKIYIYCDISLIGFKKSIFPYSSEENVKNNNHIRRYLSDFVNSVECQAFFNKWLLALRLQN